MKFLRKQRLDRYYVSYSENNTSLERQIMRELCDPNRIYDAKPVDIGAIKGGRLA
jgi:hypothetical protein